MKRIQHFEFEDFAWFPEWGRSCMTRLIVVLHKIFGASEVIAGLVEGARKRTDFRQIIAMGSGSGGATQL